jgi:hypothetical protein
MQMAVTKNVLNMKQYLANSEVKLILKCNLDKYHNIMQMFVSDDSLWWRWQRWW